MSTWHERLDDEIVDEESIHRMWRGIEARRTKQKPRWAWPVAATLAVAAGALLAVLSQPAPPGPLQLATGAPMPDRIVESTTLSDGSIISPVQSSYRVLVNRADALTGLVSEGTTRFEVTPGGTRRWTIECGLAQVEVVGTVFDIERGEDAVRVRVERGTVLVRSVHLADGVRRLEAGESVRVQRAPDPPQIPTDAPAVEGPEPEPVEEAPVQEPTARRRDGDVRTVAGAGRSRTCGGRGRRGRAHLAGCVGETSASS